MQELPAKLLNLKPVVTDIRNRQVAQPMPAALPQQTYLNQAPYPPSHTSIPPNNVVVHQPAPQYVARQTVPQQVLAPHFSYAPGPGQQVVQMVQSSYN